jgi:nitrate/nitrite transport system substrate-binding protein
VDLGAVAEAVYRADLYREAASALSLLSPETDFKTEGTHSGPWIAPGVPVELGADRFHDGGVFDPDDPLGYVRGLAVRSCPPEVLDGLAAVNRSTGAAPFGKRTQGESA